MKNIETPDKKSLGTIINDLRNGYYAIPDFQRDFEWDPWDVTELLKSIFEDYYIGTLLLWKASKNNIDYLSCKPIYGSEDEKHFQHIVLDGQQRLSALYYAFFTPDKKYPKRKSKYYYVIHLDKLLDGLYDEAIEYLISSKNNDELLNSEKLQFEKLIMPIKVLGEEGTNWAFWLQNLKEYLSKTKSDEIAKMYFDKLRIIFGDILTQYQISFIELDREIEVEKVCDIFQRINSTGLDLNIFDLMNALLRPKDIKLKDLWQKELQYFDSLMPVPDRVKIYALQTMSIFEQTYCAPKFLYYLIPNALKPTRHSDGSIEKIELIKSSEEFIEKWYLAVSEMKKALNILTNSSDLGAIKPKFIPYPTMLPVLSALNAAKNDQIYQDNNELENKLRYWYWSSIFTKNYSSSVESQMARDYLEVKKWFKHDEVMPNTLIEARKTIDGINLHSEDSQNSAIYKGIFCILIREGAKDFYSFTNPEYTDLEDHHIVPKSWGLKNNVKHINSILNRAPISDISNKNIIRDTLPNIYMKNLIKKHGNRAYEIFKTHLIDREMVAVLLREDFKASDFEEFITLRDKAIKNKISELLGMI